FGFYGSPRLALAKIVVVVRGLSRIPSACTLRLASLKLRRTSACSAKSHRRGVCNRTAMVLLEACQMACRCPVVWEVACSKVLRSESGLRFGIGKWLLYDWKFRWQLPCGGNVLRSDE